MRKHEIHSEIRPILVYDECRNNNSLKNYNEDSQNDKIFRIFVSTYTKKNEKSDFLFSDKSSPAIGMYDKDNNRDKIVNYMLPKYHNQKQPNRRVYMGGIIQNPIIPFLQNVVIMKNDPFGKLRFGFVKTNLKGIKFTPAMKKTRSSMAT